jgi:hypothetical protein
MPVAVVEAAPFVLVKPTILLGDALTGIQIECGSNQIEAEPESDESTTETFCGTYTTYKPEVWTITLTALTSFGPAGLWNLVRPLAGQSTPFLITPDSSRPIGPDNVAMSGTAIVKPFAWLSAAVGETSDFDLILAVQGIPEFLETPPTGTFSEGPEGQGPEGQGPEGQPLDQSAAA